MTPYRTKAQLIITVDDTDRPGEGGTGQVARSIAQRLSEISPAWGVTRHQLAVLPQINYTKKNSANSVHLLAAPSNLERLADELLRWLDEVAQPGAEPGLCIADPNALLQIDLGLQAQRRVVSKHEVREAAQAAHVILAHARPEDDGIVGAFAGACLAASGNDGRFVQGGELRALSGRVGVEDLIAAGADEVRTTDESALTASAVLAERIRPALRCGKRIVYCVPQEDGLWTPIKGGPGDE